MSTLLLNQLQSVFTPSAVTDLVRTLNENPTSTQKAVAGLLPAITSGVIDRAADDQGAHTLYQLLKSTPFDADPDIKQLVETSTHRQKAAESGNALLRQLFDQPPHRLAEATAQYSGISIGSAGTLTGLVMSVLMGFLHQQITSRNLTETQLVSLLQNESTTVHGAIPAALAGLIGWFIGTGASRPLATTPIGSPEPLIPPVENREETGTPWWRWLLYILIPILLLLFLLRNCNRDKTETVNTTQQTNESGQASATDTVASDLDGNEAASASPEVRVGIDLPGGRKLNVVENSFNYALATFLATKGGQLPKVFTFDNLTFDTNSAQITTKAQPNVDNLIQIMEAYPSLRIRIEGNTDSTGDDAINDPLSADRAEAVKAALVKAGIDIGRVATRERGDSKPVASNQTQAGRQKNRRIDVVVTKI